MDHDREIPEVFLDLKISTYTQKLFGYVSPYIDIKVNEYTGERFNRSEAYTTICYLSANSSKRAKKLKAEMGRDSSNLVISMDENKQVTEEFEGATFWWSANTKLQPEQVISFFPAQEAHSYYKLTFHCRHRELAIDRYLAHVIKEGKAISVRNRQRKLDTNITSESYSYGYKKLAWSHVPLEHPATFETLGMDQHKKQEIINDLDAFSKAEEYYKKIINDLRTTILV